MARITHNLVPDEVLELAALLHPTWADVSAGIPAWHPRLEGDADADADAGDDKDTGADKDADKADKVDHSDRPNWESEARKHERRAKQERKEREALEKRLSEIEGQNKTEQEKAIETARAEARAEAETEAQKERRQDRLEVASTRIATKGITIKGEDGKDTVLRFKDPDDALVYVDRAIRAGDIDEDDIFNDEGKVQTEALSSALQDILESKPHLLADGNGTTVPKVKGSADGGKGSAGKDEESKSTDEIFQSIQSTK